MIVLPGFSLLKDPDTLWHIRTGQWILDNAQFPVVDFYSYTAVGKRWIAGEWLSEILFALAFNVGEWRGVVILSAITIAAVIATLSFYLVRNLRFSVAIGWTMLTAFAISPHYLARPHLFSFLLLLVWLIILTDAYDSGDFKPSIFILAILIVFWANLHGSFTLGLALLIVFSVYFCCEKFLQRDYVRCQTVFVMLLAVGVGALLTPYGYFFGSCNVRSVKNEISFSADRRVEIARLPNIPTAFIFTCGSFCHHYRIRNSIARSEINRVQHHDVLGLEPSSRTSNVFLGCPSYSCAADCVPFCLVARHPYC